MEKTATKIVTPFERTIRYNQEQNGDNVRNFLVN